MNEDQNLALFCDFENIALGVRDAKYAKFDIGPVLERLLLKGSIVAKKAYCDWDRYKQYKPGMHEAAFELIEIPHVKMSGKNSADIRMVVDALDLCYTKEHIDTFVIISGDSDFSPLVSKLRENAKTVIGVGVKNSTSDLLMSNCDEFIYYDDLVPNEGSGEKAAGKTRSRKRSKKSRKKKTAAKADPAQEAINLVIETTEALYSERGDKAKLWGSMIKQTLKRRRPGFSESVYGFSSFSDLLEEAAKRKQLELERDEKSGGYIVRGVIDDS
ncbi:MAG: NYN domain-containing protein [Gammaproteobacteria bacterium]|nr:NYN domain-containing protein [Gammaproteobacteria bacterium]